LQPGVLSHPEAFAMRDSEDLPAVRAVIDITLAEDPSQKLHQNGPQLFAAVRTDRLNVVSVLQIQHKAQPFLLHSQRSRQTIFNQCNIRPKSDFLRFLL